MKFEAGLGVERVCLSFLGGVWHRWSLTPLIIVLSSPPWGFLMFSLLLLSNQTFALEDARDVCDARSTPSHSSAYRGAIKKWNNKFSFIDGASIFSVTGRENFQPWILDSAPCFWLSPYSPYRNLPDDQWFYGIPIPLKKALNRQVIGKVQKIYEFYNFGEASSDGNREIQVPVTAIKHHGKVFLEVNNNGERIIWLHGNKFLWSYRRKAGGDHDFTDARLSDLDGDGNLELSAWYLHIESLNELMRPLDVVLKEREKKQKQVCKALEFMACDGVLTDFHDPDFQIYLLDNNGVPKPVRYGKWGRWYKEEALRIYPDIQVALHAEIEHYNQVGMDKAGHEHKLKIQIRKLFFVLEGTGDKQFIGEIYKALDNRFGRKLWDYVDAALLAKGMAMYGYTYMQEII